MKDLSLFTLFLQMLGHKVNSVLLLNQNFDILERFKNIIKFYVHNFYCLNKITKTLYLQIFGQVAFIKKKFRWFAW